MPGVLRALLGAGSAAEADAAYWRLDNVVIVQGRLHEAALATMSCLAVGLGRATLFGRPRALELMVQIASGEAEEDELVSRCRAELLPCGAVLLDLLERGTDEESVHCIDLLGLCALHAPVFRERAAWHLAQYGRRPLDAAVRRLLNAWLADLTEHSSQ